ncbi:IS110 family transposase [Micromonospora globispora]|nr:transposase [Micromonospora globispora]
MLAELVEVVIGVDTHKHTHTAAVIDARTGAVLDRATVTADPDGYAEPLGLAERQSGLRAWAVEGTGGYGAGLARHLADVGELVVELDRPKRPARRAGAKSDPIDAERAARDALARTHLAQPKTGPERAALQMRLTARRAAVEAATTAQRQLHAMVITAPEAVRTPFRGQNTRAMISTAARLRPTVTSGDVQLITAPAVLRDLARRIRTLQAEAAGHEAAIRAIVRSWRPDLLALTGVGPIVAATQDCDEARQRLLAVKLLIRPTSPAGPAPAAAGGQVASKAPGQSDQESHPPLPAISSPLLNRPRHAHSQSRVTASRRRCSGGRAAHDQNGAGPRPANDINTCVASSLRMPVTATVPIRS